MAPRIAKEIILRAGRAGRALIGEDRYQRLLHSQRGQNLLHGLGFTPPTPAELFAPRLTDDELARLNDREIEMMLSLAVRWVYDTFIEGDIVEFGTATGFSARVIARAMRLAEAMRPPKTLHLYDSFDGLPEATSEVDRASFEFRSGVWQPGSMKSMSEEELASICGGLLSKDRVVTHKGWFADTIATLSPGQKFAFVHFDGDMYQSCIDAVGGLLKAGAISNGAVICFDDWNCGQADPAYGERRAWRELTEQYAVHCSPWRAYSTMGQCFFIHDYRRA